MRKVNKKKIDQSILDAVTQHASTFKEYLDGTESVVKMFSERRPCEYNQGGCNKFLDNILPETEGTAVGYFTEKTSDAGNREVGKFSTHMVKAYQDYINTKAEDYFGNDIDLSSEDWLNIDNLRNAPSSSADRSQNIISSSSSYSDMSVSDASSSEWSFRDLPSDSRLVVLGVGGGQYPLNTYLDKRIFHHNTSTSTDS